MSDNQLDQIYKQLLDLPDAKERRIDRLLQAAAVIYAADKKQSLEKAQSGVISEARWLLEEIERRES